MDDGTLKQVLSGLQLLALVVAIVGGAWALRRLRREPLVGRPERGAATASAVAAAIMAALGTFALAPSSNSVGGPIVLLLICGMAIVFGGLAGLAALLGYVLLARPRIGGIALAGVVAGPLLLGGTVALATAWKQDLDYAPNRAAAAAAARAVTDRSRSVHVSVEDVAVSPATRQDSAGRDVVVVGEVSLTLVVAVDHDIGFIDPQGFPADASISLVEPTSGLGMNATSTQHESLAAAKPSRFAVVFRSIPLKSPDADLHALGEPGVWTLRVLFLDARQLTYDVSIPVAIPGVSSS